jgi:hypothetical protein
MKTRIPRDVATARRAKRPNPAAMGTAGWAQAEADRARIRTVLRAPPDWRAPATTSVPASSTKQGAAGAPANIALTGGHAPDPARPRVGEQAEAIAKDGISGSRTSLSYLDRVQASFGAAHVVRSTSVHQRTQQYPPGWTCESERPTPVPVPDLPRLKVGAINDPLEHEADRSANQVMRMPAPETAPTFAQVQLSRKSEEEKVQNRSTALEVHDRTALESVREALRSPGQPLDASSRGYFEPRFGHDFSRVRVHSDAGAAQSARDINARAYTVGNNIVFGAGPFAPGEAAGRQLLAHELAHVVQNTAARAADTIRRTPDPPPEPPAKIVSPVWNVQGRPVVVVEFDGRRKAFYQRSGDSPRPEGHAGPQSGDWAPFDGWQPSKKAKGSGHFVKEGYHRDFEPEDPLHGYGNEKNKQVATWLGRQKLEPPATEQHWEEVQAELEKLGVKVRRPLPPRGTPGGGGGGGPPPSDKPSQPAAKESTEQRPAEPPPAKKSTEPPAAKKSTEPPPAKKSTEPPLAKKSTEPPPAKKSTEPPPAKKSTEPPPAKKSTEPPPATKKPPEPPGAKKPTKASDVEPSQSGGAAAAISAAQRAYTNIAGQFSNRLMRVASERVKDKEMADALADINKIMDAHAFLSNPKQYSAQFIADYMIDGAFGKFARQLAAAEAQFFSTYPDVRSFHQQSLGGRTSLDDLKKHYDQAVRNLRLPSARKTLVTVFLMLDITDKTPQKEIDRRIQIINEYLAKQPDIGRYVKEYNDAHGKYAFGLTVVRAQLDNLRQQLGELPAGFADDIRRRGDALHKAAKVIDDFYDQVIPLAALPGGDIALYMLMKLSDGFSGLGDGLYDFAYRAGARQGEYKQEIQRLEAQADKLNILRGAFDVIYPKSSP